MAKRILIVGGVAGGASAATRARRLDEEAEIVIFEKDEHVSFANCGLPYHIGGQIVERSKLLLMTPQAFKQTFNIDVQTRCEVRRIDREGKRIEVLNRDTEARRWEGYDKLILSPGAAPIMPPWPGADATNVFTLRNVADMDLIKAFVHDRSPRRAVVVGGGFIGLEMVDVLTQRGLAVSLVEKLPQVMPLLDEDMAGEVERILRSQEVDLKTAQTVVGLARDVDRVTSVLLESGETIETDMVVVSVGVKPTVGLAQQAGLVIGQSGGIAVNERMQTNDPDIYAVGDAAEVVFRPTSRTAVIPLAGPANRNGRAAGGHAAADHSFSATPVLGTAIVGVFGHAVAMTGMSVKSAKAAGIPLSSTYAIRGHHVGYYPGAEQMILKLVFNPETGQVLGAQAVGGSGVDKRIDVVATAMHFGGTVDDLAGLDLAYAPQFGAAKDPVHIAAFGAQNVRDGLVAQIMPGEAPIEGQVVDVRSPAEFANGALAGAVNIPLPELRSRLDELDRDRPIMVNCGVGQRSYNACRILMQNGFKEVWNLAGGYHLHRHTWASRAYADVKR